MTVTNPTGAPTDDASVTGTVVDLKDLVIAYARQETIDPLKALVRFVGFGIAGSLLLAVGTVVGSLTVVRAIQTETTPHLTGDWSWVPYVGGILFALLMAGLAALRIARAQ